MKLRLLGVLALLLCAASAPLFAVTATLQLVASFPDKQVTGVAVSKTGRIFVCFPDWSDDHTISVAEVIDGNPKPYPNEEWNQAGRPKDHFVCVQSLHIDESDSLWILDPASPKMEGVVKDGPKLVKVDLVKNEIVQTIQFEEEIAPKKSYLNDVRVDTKTQTAYITDSGLAAIVVVDLTTGKARRVLEDDAATRAEKDFKLQVNGRELLGENGKPPQINSDGIALDHLNGYLYFHALTANMLHRIKTDDLRNRRLTKSQLSAKVEPVLETPPPDGMAMGPDGRLYLTDVEHGAVQVLDLKEDKLGTVIVDGRLSWPDSLAWGPDGSLFVTTSQIQTMPRFNGGKDVHATPYHVYKVTGAPGAP
jgi:sugar lactone lactonase YvrE